MTREIDTKKMYHIPAILSEDAVIASLEKMIETLNEKCPRAIDERTRLMGASMGLGKTISYQYVILDIDNKTIDFDAIRVNTRKHYRHSEDMAFMRDNEVRMEYIYSSRGGQRLCKFAVGKPQYGKLK